MPVYEASNGTWYVKLSYIDEFGDRKYKTKRNLPTRGKARKWEDEFFIKLQEGESSDYLSFTVLSEHYIEWYSKRRKPSSIKTIKNYVNNHLDPYFKKMNVYRMSTKDILNFHDHMTNKMFRDKPLKKGYIQDVHTALSSILNHGVKFYDLKKNVAALAGNIENDETPSWDYWTLNEFEYFYNQVDDILIKTYYRLLFFSGLRHGELRALTWNDVNLIDGYVDINKTNYNGKVHTPKTKTSIRKVYIPKHVINLLHEYKIWYKREKEYKDDYVVFGNFYKSYGESTIPKRYDKIMDEIDLKRIKTHEFRHSHASDCINRLRMDRETLAKRLGHSSSITIEKIYGHLYPSTEKDAILDL